MMNQHRSLLMLSICAVIFSAMGMGFGMEPAVHLRETPQIEDSVDARPVAAIGSLDYILGDAYIEELKRFGDLDLLELLAAATAGDADKVSSLMKMNNYFLADLYPLMTRVVRLKQFEGMKAMIEGHKRLAFDAYGEAAMMGYIEGIVYCKSFLNDWERMAHLVEVCATDEIKEEDRIPMLPYLKRDLPPGRLLEAAVLLEKRGHLDRLFYLSLYDYI